MKEVIKIEGGHALKGTVRISGSKNATVALIPAAILANGPVTIVGVPNISDVESLAVLLRDLGVDVCFKAQDHIIIDPTHMQNRPMTQDAVQKLRASYYFMGALLGKYGRVEMKMPGGCYLGPRPIDLHLKGFELMGAKVEYAPNYVEASADRLKGARIYLDYPSVGATENIMAAAALADGTTIIENVAKEPEIVDLANFLNKMGAKVKGAGTDLIKIEGVERLHGTKHIVIPDRIETGTFMVAAAITRGDLLIKNVVPDHVRPIISKLIECGCTVEDTIEGLRVKADEKDLVATDIKTLPYPGFPTDMQSQFMALLTTVEGRSTVIETVFENRYMHISELNRMGADISIEGRSAVVQGGASLSGCQVMSTDLRAGAALVLAGLAAKGVTEISEIYHIERGYSQFVEKLRAIGAGIERVE